MGKKSKYSFARIEPGLSEANREIIGWDRSYNHWKKTMVEMIVKEIITAMITKSPHVFAEFKPKTFGAGSSYEGLKADKDGDFDIDILLQIPEKIKYKLDVDTIPGNVRLQLLNVETLKQKRPQLYSVVNDFMDDTFVCTDKLKSTLMQSIFDSARCQFFHDGIITVNKYDFKIDKAKVSLLSPALTLTIVNEDLDFFVEIDLVPCIVFPKKDWPKSPFRSNLLPKPSNFFIVPKPPKHRQDHPHVNRYFRLSFQQQEKIIISDRLWMKPTIRIMKLIKRHFKHEVSSYAIKTLFLWELVDDSNCYCGLETPPFWKGPFSRCLITMLEKYLKCLKAKRINYFWYSKLDLLTNLSDQECESYSRHIEKMLKHIKSDPNPGTILSYLTEIEN